ncbi:MAG TPA: hypothetical protein VG818_04025, partial [Gemmatimonadaceae bacterium]|nr:hypothetical protein [Gemmatimonadaceae bacterium]
MFPDTGKAAASSPLPPRTLASLAHALSAAPDLRAALIALAEALAELDRFASVALVDYDGRRGLMRTRHLARPDGVESKVIDTTFDHLPTRERVAVGTTTDLVEFGATSDEFARLFELPAIPEGGLLAAKGIRFEGALAAILVLYEPRKVFGTRTTERIAPSIALFELAHARFLEGVARREAVQTLEDVTRRVHDEYDRKLAALEQELLRVTGEFHAVGDGQGRVVTLERELASAREEARRLQRRADAVEATV